MILPMIKNKKLFKLKSKYSPAGDQPQAIKKLSLGLAENKKHQTLLGVTGSGKTFTIANVIADQNKPALVIAHNKTLAAQLAQEYREFFPENAVHYFVSYYDYYIPEAYMPGTDTYIEKDADINEEIDRLRHASTQSLLTRRDCIIVASVSCIYGLGDPEEYLKVHLNIKKEDVITRQNLMRKLVNIYFERTNADLKTGKFRAVGNVVEVVSANEEVIWRIEFLSNKVKKIQKIDFITRKIISEPDSVFLFPAKHFITPEGGRDVAITNIKKELSDRLSELKKENSLLAYERLKRRTRYDLEMIKEVGYVKGIENYSRHLSGKAPGDPPDTLLSYFPHTNKGEPDFLTIIDESHVTVPQIRGMYSGDESRKKTLIEYGFRLPSALDNRPLKFSEFQERVSNLIYTSATPSAYEIENSKKCGKIVEQIIRPTGLIDPSISVRPIISCGKYGGQIYDLMDEIEITTNKKERSIATTLTKKMAEDLSEYLADKGIKAKYIHSEVKTLDRIKILTDFRKGEFDCIVGVNLLREGLDLPEVSFIGILDADKEGFLRSETALIQTIGRAARNVSGRVILYADKMTGSMKRSIEETDRRRKIQIAYNKKYNITPKTIIKGIKDITDQIDTKHKKAVKSILKVDKEIFNKKPRTFIKQKQKQMLVAVKELDFETAALIRDEIKELKKMAGVF